MMHETGRVKTYMAFELQHRLLGDKLAHMKHSAHALGPTARNSCTDCLLSVHGQGQHPLTSIATPLLQLACRM